MDMILSKSQTTSSVVFYANTANVKSLISIKLHPILIENNINYPI